MVFEGCSVTDLEQEVLNLKISSDRMVSKVNDLLTEAKGLRFALIRTLRKVKAESDYAGKDHQKRRRVSG